MKIDIKQAAVLLLALILFLIALSKFGWVVLFINSLVALIVLKVLSWLGVKIKIDMFSILIAVLWGMPGVLIMMFLALTGIAFKEKK
jgi:hypothetical protein